MKSRSLATKHIPGDPDKVKWLGKVVAQIGEAATKYEHGDLTKPPLKAGWGALTKKAGREANVPPPPSVPPPPFVPTAGRALFAPRWRRCRRVPTIGWTLAGNILGFWGPKCPF